MPSTRSILAILAIVSILTCGSRTTAQCLDWMDTFEEDFWGANNIVSAAISGELNGEQAVYVAGGFTRVGGIIADRIARWNGVSWTALGEGLNGSASSMCWFDDGTGLALYVAGNISQAGGQSTSGLVRWRDGVWEDLGAEFDNRPTALIVHNDILFVGGWFRSVTGQSTQYLAAWDGQQWTAFPDGPDDRVFALASFGEPNDSQLIVAGEFRNAGGLSANRIAALDASGTWIPMGSGLDDECHALLPDPANPSEQLYVAGSFRAAGGIGADHIAIWDGATWSPVNASQGHPSGGVTGPVYALAAIEREGQTRLALAGSFSEASDGTTSSRYIEWDGTAWHAAREGLGTVRAYCVSAAPILGGDLVLVGGDFDSADGKPSDHIAVFGVSCAKPTVVEHPRDTVASFDRPIGFDVQAWGTRPLTYRWRRDGVPLVDDGRVQGTTTQHLRIFPWQYEDEGVYDCMIANDFGTAISNHAIVVLPGADLPVVPATVQLTTPAPAPWDSAFILDGIFGTDLASTSALAGYAFRRDEPSAVYTLWLGEFFPIAIEGQSLPFGDPDEIFALSGNFDFIRSAPDNTSSFIADISGPNVDRDNDRGLWAFSAGGLERVMREGDEAPGLPDGVVFGHESPRQIDQLPGNRTMFTAWATGGPFGDNSREGLWVKHRGEAAHLLGLVGEAAPGTDTTFVGFGRTFAGSGNTDVLFYAGIDSRTGHSDSNGFDQGLWLGPPSDLALIVKSGDPAPGFPDDTNIVRLFVQNRHPLITDSGIMFDAIVAGPDGFKAWATYNWNGTGLQYISGDGHVVPSDDGPVSIRYSTPYSASDRGEVLFRASVINSSREGLWLYRPGRSVQFVCDERTELPEGVSNRLGIEAFNHAAMNNRQQFAIEIRCDNSPQLNGVFGWTTNRGLFPIVVPGSLIAVSDDDDVRVVLSAGLVSAHPEYNEPVSFALDDQGEITFLAAFTDGTTGLFRGQYADYRDAYFTCTADFNGDDIIDTRDIIAFLNAWSRGDWAADLNGDDRINTLDVIQFFSEWTIDC